jgi:hypothetical protein
MAMLAKMVGLAWLAAGIIVLFARGAGGNRLHAGGGADHAG